MTWIEDRIFQTNEDQHNKYLNNCKFTYIWISEHIYIHGKTPFLFQPKSDSNFRLPLLCSSAQPRSLPTEQQLLLLCRIYFLCLPHRVASHSNENILHRCNELFLFLVESGLIRIFVTSRCLGVLEENSLKTFQSRIFAWGGLLGPQFSPLTLQPGGSIPEEKWVWGSPKMTPLPSSSPSPTERRDLTLFERMKIIS